MGKCKYCGKDAGFLVAAHKKCQSHALETMAYFTTVAQHVFQHGGDEKELRTMLERAAVQAGLQEEEKEKAALEALGQSVAEAMEDGVVSAEEESNLLLLVKILRIHESKLHATKWWPKLVKSRVISQIMEGTLPETKHPGHLKVVLQKGESLIWVFSGVKFYEPQTRRVTVARSAAASRVMGKGKFVSASAFASVTGDYTALVQVDTGELILTNKTIYFQGPQGVVKLPAKKLLAIDPYRDAIGLQLDAASPKLRLFENVDGWFAYNVATNLHLLEKTSK